MALTTLPFGNGDTADRQRPVAPLDKLSLQLVKEATHALLLDGLDGDAINPGRAAVSGDLQPRCP